MHEDAPRVDAILAGSTQAWHSFVQEHEGLIRHTLGRQLFDEEERRTVHAEVLHQLRRSKLAAWKRRCSLATWVVLVARNAARDHLRRRLGRRHVQRAVAGLGPRQRELFRLRYLKGWDYPRLMEHLAGQGTPLSVERLGEELDAVERAVGLRWRRRLDYERAAASLGAISSRLLEFLDAVRPEIQERRENLDPGLGLMEQEARRVLDALRRAREELPDEDQQVLRLRFEESLSAAEIAERLGLESRRRAYWLLERALGRLRRRMPLTGLMD